ncbi:MAG: tetratricopeptide repeat protein [Deltaproteobacteria bacterium]|nr:tetratricopeptide repeat protein [Deltaproteobacteria bacterium]
MKKREGTRSRRAKNTSASRESKPKGDLDVGSEESDSDIVQLGDQDVDPDDVEFLDEDLLVVENTGEVRIGEISGDDDKEKTAVAFRSDVLESARVQRVDLEDLDDMGENAAFLDRPTAELNLDSEHGDLQSGRRALDVAAGFGDAEPTLTPETREGFAEGQSTAPLPEQMTDDVVIEDAQTSGGAIEVSDAEVVEEVAEAVEATEESGSESAAEASMETQASAGEPGLNQTVGGDTGTEPHEVGSETSTEDEAEAVRHEGAAGQSEFDMDRDAYQEQAHRLALKQRWEELATLTRQALDGAVWARSGSARATLLGDLGRIFRDRLRDLEQARSVFEEELEEDPASRDAMEFLTDFYEKKGQWQKLYTLLVRGAETTWDPAERMERTRRAAQMAMKRLDSADMAMAAWEKLWKLGAREYEVRSELMKLYRDTERWKELAAFLVDDAQGEEAAERRVQIRQVVELSLYGSKDYEQARTLVEELLADGGTDAIALLAKAEVLARQKDWSGLGGLVQSSEDVLPAEAVSALTRMAADEMWKGGRHKEATGLYRRVLEKSPADEDASAAVEQVLKEAGQFEELLALLEKRLHGVDDRDLKASVLERMALVADREMGDVDRAIDLWVQRSTVKPEDMTSWLALADLYEKVERWEELATALRKQLDLRRDPSGKKAILSQLGSLYAHQLSNDDEAEACWRDVLTLDPEDVEARNELMALHRRRGEFDALDRALAREIAMADDPQVALDHCREAAINAQDNLSNSERALAAWLRVLDRAPDDLQALDAAVTLLGDLGDRDRMILFLERQARASEAIEAKVSALLRGASAARDQGQVVRAAAFYERVLRLVPSNLEAGEGLVRLWIDAGKPDRAVALTEFLNCQIDDVRARAGLLRLVADGFEGTDRYRMLRSVAVMESPTDEALNVLEALAIETGRVEDFLSLLDELADRGADLVPLRLRGARICSEALEAPDRAMAMILESFHGVDPGQAVFDGLIQIADKVGRYEQVMAAYQSVARSDPGRRSILLRTAAALVVEKLDNGPRAFHLVRRAFLVDTADEEVWKELQEVAGKYELWTELGETMGDLLSTVDRARFMELVRERHDVLLGKLSDRLGAFHQLELMYRASAPDKLQDFLEKAAKRLKQWDYFLPMAEAAWIDSDARMDHMPGLAKQYQTLLKDKERAQDLMTAILEQAPTVSTDDIETLAGATKRWAAYCDGLRFAAARSQDVGGTLQLLRQAANASSEHGLDAVEIHNRIVSVDPTVLESLEVCIENLRTTEDAEALEHRLQQWIACAPSDADRVSKYLELASLAEARGQPEQALVAYTEVLDLAPDNEKARQALDVMSDKLSAEQRQRKLKLELARAEGETLVSIGLELARHQRETLEDSEGAIETLVSLVGRVGTTGPIEEVLERLLAESGRWMDLADFVERRGDAQQDHQVALRAFEEALTIRLEHERDQGAQVPDHAVRIEGLCRKVLGVNPEDTQALVLLLFDLRSQGQYQEMAEQLEKVAGVSTEPERRFWALSELARVYEWGLSDPGEAGRIYRLLEETEMGAGCARLALARLAGQDGDWSGYIRWREAEAATQPDVVASLVYCHLAEVNDRFLQQTHSTLSLYRKARLLDETNPLAKVALKALGRRVKSWKKGATLLPDGEELDFEQAGAKLLEFARSASGEERRQWLWKTVVVRPDAVDAWDLLAEEYGRMADWEHKARALWAGVQALDRTTAPGRELATEVDRLHATAAAWRAASKERDADILEHRAFELNPKDVRAALAVANERFDREDFRGAFKLFGELATRSDLAMLDVGQQAMVSYRLGESALRMGDPHKAQDAFRKALEKQPLHAGALIGLGGELVHDGRNVDAARTFLRALVVANQSEARAHVYSSLGVLLEDAFGHYEEAGACYGRAMQEGAEQLDVMWRALRFMQRSERLEEAAELVSRMLKLVTDPEDLAALWVARGQIHAAHEGQEDQAMEAFDMALSYEPGNRGALDGLAAILERRGEWGQLLEVLEATQDLLSEEKRSEVLVRMADIASERFGDSEKAEAYLRMAAELRPNRQVFERLKTMYESKEDYTEELKMVLAGMVRFGPPYFDLIVRLGNMLVAEGRRRWAWCLLSLLSEVRKVDRDLKSSLRDMRKEFDKSFVPVVTEDDYEKMVRSPDHSKTLQEALAEMEQVVDLSRWSDFGSSTAIGERTGLGNAFGEVAKSLGLDHGMAWRVDGQGRSLVVGVGQGPQLLLDAEFARRLVQNEVRFVFGYGMELSRPGNRILAVGDDADRLLFGEALLAWLDDRTVSAAAQTLADAFKEALGEERSAALAQQLDAVRGVAPADLVAKQWIAVQATARRVGLLMSGELHLTLRALDRLAGEQSSLQVDVVSDLDERITAHPEWVDLLAWAADARFEGLLLG